MALTDIAPIATAVSSIAAVTTLIVGLRRYTREIAERKATTLRTDLGAFLAELQELEQLMKSGIPLIVAATSTVGELRKRFGGDVLIKDMLEALEREPQLSLSIAVTSWSDVPLTRIVSDRSAALLLRAQRLQGGLALLHPVTRLLDGISSDGYSGIVFHRLLSAGDVIVNGLQGSASKSLSDGANALLVTLQGNATLYFAARYEKALSEIRNFAETAVRTLSGLPDHKLLAISARQEGYRESTATMTGEIKQRLRDIQGELPVGSINQLFTITEKIETFVDKDFASHELRNRFSRDK